MECEFPTTNSSDEQIIKLLKETKTIAIVGLSPNETKDSNKVGKYLQNAGYKIIPIYPKEEYILGEKVYRSLADVPEGVDMVDMFRKASFADELLEIIKQRKDIKSLWLQIGLVNNEVIDEIQKMGLIGVQNKCTKIEHQRAGL
jgi:predicted CoA-binding protein